ncbi:MAG: DUF5110 domain-containing protein [Bacteroidales bacterium]|nr:DUF5110 domain-containing protein [Bacteroidales bacterium]
MFNAKIIRNAALMLAALLASACTKTQEQSQMSTNVSDRHVVVTAVTDNIIRVESAAEGQQALPSRATVLDGLAQGAKVKVSKSSDVLSTPSGLTATLNKADGNTSINGGVNKIVNSTNEPIILPDGRQCITLKTTSRGAYYGAGERGHSINLRGDTLVMYNRQNYGYTQGDPRISQMNITMPLFISSDGFAILFDDYAAAEMILGEDDTIKYITENPNPITYYYINGAETIADVTRELTSLTGRQPLPPLWSLGYITSKYGYHNEKETVGAIDSLKKRGYPVDGIVLDLYWYGKEQDMGRLAWEPKQWPNPEKMLANLKDQNVNLIAISQPYVLRNGKAIDNYNELAPKGMFMADTTGQGPQEVTIWVGEGGMFDVSNPDTRAWMRQRYKELTDGGITGWWGDLGEPEVHPNGLHHNGLTSRQYHNQYGNDWSEIISELFAEEYPDTRLVTMMRGGTTGLQRYSVFPWSTDVSRSWGGLQPQVTIMLNSGLSGLGYMGHDVGGFAVDKEHPEDAELYVRWLQLGTFSPMLRTHAQYKAEPYHYPKYASIILPLIKERYRWLPYNYTLAYENAQYGYPLVRPLNFTEAGSHAYDAINDEYLWGSEVLIAPVLTQGATEREVTFPQGTWVDFKAPFTQYQGGSTVTYPAPLEVLPMFAKAGAFIPMADNAMTSTADYDPANLTVQFFPVEGVSSEFTLYDDNRLDPKALEKGEYRLIHFKGEYQDGTITVSISTEGTYPGAADELNFLLVFNGVKPEVQSIGLNAGDGTQTTYNGQAAMGVKFNPSQSPIVTVQP